LAPPAARESLSQLKAAAMSEYVVIVTDSVLSDLAEHRAQRYVSAPQPPEQARGLVRVLVDLPEPPTGRGPWRRARAGGQRTVRLEASR
jgi:hypothetical protein